MNCARILRRADPYLKALVLIAIVVYLLEIASRVGAGYPSHPFFPWAERVIALIFTLEYVARWIDDAQDNKHWHYPHSPLGIVDLISTCRSGPRSLPPQSGRTRSGRCGYSGC